MPPHIAIRILTSLNLIVCFLAVVHHYHVHGYRTAEVETPLGRMRGVQTLSRDGNLYYEFRGIPYAKPPLGNLRFEPPVPSEPWGEELLDATIYKPFCLQYDLISRVRLGSESCLYLNVATPKLPSLSTQNDTELLPVIVFIYGGAFMSGFSDVFTGSYFLDQDVVFVAMNYRLGVFGFLNTGDDVVRGNMGLKDQTLALQWVQDNIRSFGGDPDSVTLMGQSAGGISVHLHMFSSLSKGLFHRGISMSGNALNNFLLVKHPRKQALRLGRYMNCPTNDTQAMVDCLRAIPALTVNRANKEYTNMLEGRMGFYGPSIESVVDEGAFLTAEPRELLEAGNITRVPWVVGNLPNEGLLFAILLLKNRPSRELLESPEWVKYAPSFFTYDDHPNSTEITRAIQKIYLGNEEFGSEELMGLSRMMTDRMFFDGTYDAVRLQSKLSPVYAYEFMYKGEVSFANILAGMTRSRYLPRTLGLAYSAASQWLSEAFNNRRRTQLYGCHSDDLLMFFYFPFVSRHVQPGTRDYAMSAEMVRAWVTFAKDGVPGEIFGAAWNPVPANYSESSGEMQVYLKIDNSCGMIEENFTSRIQLWKSILGD